MLDSLEWSVNKTPLGDARLNTRHVDEETLAEDQYPSVKCGARTMESATTSAASPRWLCVVSQSRTRASWSAREIGEVEQMHRPARDESAPPPEIVAAQIMAGVSGAGLRDFLPETP
jgi:hypothetical protein